MGLAVIIPAAGRGERLGAAAPKALAPLLGEPLLTHTCRALLGLPGVTHWIVLAPPGAEAAIEAACRTALGPEPALTVQPGGAERADSVRIGLAAVPDTCEMVAVHDAARPCVSAADLTAVLERARETGAAILARPCTDTVKQSQDGRTIDATLDRTTLWLAQTPQVFRTALLADALAAAGEVTDEAGAVERLGTPVSLVPGSVHNLKVTTPEDVPVAEVLLRKAVPCA